MRAAIIVIVVCSASIAAQARAQDAAHVTTSLRVQGPRDEASVRVVLDAATSTIGECTLVLNLETTLNLAIDARGRVSSVRTVLDPRQPASATACVSAKVRALRFARTPSAARTTVRWVTVLNAQSPFGRDLEASDALLRTTGDDSAPGGMHGQRISGILRAGPGANAAPELTREDIRTVMDQNRDAFRACGARLPAAEASRRITLHFTIAADGHVNAANAETGDESEALTACVLSVARTMQFPAAADREDTPVVYPFVFQHEE